MLGKGTYGKVYARGDVAIKQFNEADYSAYREIVIVSLLDHENIIKWRAVHALGLSVEMQRYDCDLGAAKGIDVAAVMRQVISGVAYMHLRGFIHGDLKPANILIKLPDIAVIADFGIARPICARRSTCTGSGRYRAPEVSGGPIGPPADCWSLGIMLRDYHLNTYNLLDPDPSRRTKATEISNSSAQPAFTSREPLSTKICQFLDPLRLAETPEITDMAEGLFLGAKKQTIKTAEAAYFLAACLYGVPVDYTITPYNLSLILQRQRVVY